MRKAAWRNDLLVSARRRSRIHVTAGRYSHLHGSACSSDKLKAVPRTNNGTSSTTTTCNIPHANKKRRNVPALHHHDLHHWRRSPVSTFIATPRISPPITTPYRSSLRSISTTIPCYYNDKDNNTITFGTSSSSDTTATSTTTTTKKAPRPTVHNTAPSFRAIKVFFTGELENVNVKSTELIKTSKIHARDLFDLNLTSRQERRRRKISRISSSAAAAAAGAGGSAQKGPVRRALAAILPRKASIVISFAQIRAVVGRHYVLFLEAHDPTVQDFAKELSETYRHLANQQRYNHLTTKRSCGGGAGGNDDSSSSNGEAMELLFLEEVLRNAVESFNRRLRLYDPIVISFLDTVANEVYSDTGVHQLVPLKDSLQSFEMHVKQCLECLTQLLDDDEEMLALLLTEQAKAAETGKPVDFQRHQHVELLLGVYARQLNNILMEIQFLLQRIQSKQEFVALALAGYRNRMVRMNVTVSIATLSLCLGTTVAGFYGMNVVNGFEDSTTAFSTIVTCSILGGLGVGGGSMYYLSGRTMQVRASQRLKEIETLAGALSDMCALDYAVKSTLEEGKTITKDEFRVKLRKARQSGEITDKEVDLLFHVFDSVKDGLLDKEDMDLIGLSRPSPTEVADPISSSSSVP